MPVNFKGGLLVNGENVTTETVVETLQEELNTKAVLGAFNGGGTGVDYADLATNLRTEQGATVEDAVAQLSPISVAVEDGDFAEMTNVKGRSFAYNQLMSSIDNVNWQASGGTVVKNNNIINLTITTTSNQEIYAFTPSGSIKNGNKYLCFVEIKSPRVSNCRFTIAESNWSFYNSVTTGNNNNVNAWSSMAAIINIDHSFSGAVIHIYPLNSASNDEVGDELQFRNVQIFDLTAMGLDSVATVKEAYAALRAYGIEPTVYNEYSAGKIIDSQPNKIISRGFNQWDEEWENGGLDGNGQETFTNNWIRNVNYTEVKGGQDYYFKSPAATYICFYDRNKNFISVSDNKSNKTFTTPSNCAYIRFTCNVSSYSNNICVNISDPALNGTYKPFVKDEHALTLPVMRSAGSVYDDKEMVRVGTVDLGDLNWSYQLAYDGDNYYTDIIPNAKTLSSVLCSKYTSNTSVEYPATIRNNAWISVTGRINITADGYNANPSAFKAAMSGVMLNYELATPVAQDPTINLPQNIKVYNGGTLETQYESPNTTPALVSMLYQVNLKNFVEGVGSKEDINWNPQNVASQIDVDKKAYKDRYYDTLGAGYSNLANNLIASKGLEVESYFTFEKTGGEQASAIETGNGTLKNLYGKTEKSENLLILNDIQGTQNGVTYKVKDGVIYLSGTSTSSNDFGLTFALQKNIPSGIYNTSIFSSDYGSYGWACFTPWGGAVYIQATQFNSVRSVEFSSERSSITILIKTGATYNCSIRPILTNSNTSPTTWKQGYEGLKHTHITGLKTTGINLFNEKMVLGTLDVSTGNVISISDRLVSEDFIEVLPNQDYYFRRGETATNMRLCYYDINHNFIKGQADGTPMNRAYTTPNLCHYIKFGLQAPYGTTYNHDICINFSNPNFNGNYYPSEQDTLDIDFEGNEWDYVDVEEKKRYEGSLEVTFNGSEDWFFGRVEDSSFESGYFYYAQYSGLPNTILKPITHANPSDIIWSGKVDSINSGRVANSMYISTAGTFQLNAPNNNAITTKADFLTWLSNNPLTIVIPLSTPIVTDVEIPKDTIKVWNGGSMEALGTEIPVGTKIFYQKNIKNFIEGLGEATEWDPNAIALEDDISDESLEKRGYYKMSVLSQTFYSTETVSDLANMGALRTFINDINSSGRHCFFDLHNYVTDAYVCIIHMWTANGVNYCFVEDLINHKTYGDYSGYADATTISTYLSSNAMSSLRVIKITDANITMADINTLLGEINTLGDHVMFDVSAITTAMYLTTIFISGSYYRVFDSVTGRAAAGNSTSGLTEKLVDVINSGIVNPTSWKDIQQIVREGNAKNVFSPGDQLDVLYLDGISSESSNQSLTVTVNADTFINKMGLSASSYIFTYSSTLNSWTLHEGAVSLSTYGVTVTGTPADGNTITVTTTTRTVVFDIVAFDKDVPADSTYTHSMTIQTHNTVGGVQYGNSQAGFQFPDGLAAGAYCFTIGNYDVTYGGNATYYFTLANAIPAGGQLRFDWPYQQQASTRSVYTYASASSGTAIESKPVSTTEISGAPNIGTLINSTIITKTITDQGGNTVTVKVNNADRMRYGSNNWENSAMRQWCNSAAVAGSVWSPKSDFDRPPSWVNSANGFLYHIDPELLAVCGEVNKITKKNTVCDGGGTVTTTDRAFPVSMGAIGVNGYMDEEPLGQYDYYKALLGGQIADWSTHAELIKKNSAGTAQYWWLRGPNPSNANYLRNVNPSGNVYSYGAHNGNQAAPALSII